MTPRVEFSQTKPWIAPRKCFQALAASLALISGPAFAQTGPVSVAPGHSPIQRIDDSVSLPGGWLAVRRDGADDLFLISGDGRYVVQPAQMVDTQTGARASGLSVRRRLRARSGPRASRRGLGRFASRRPRRGRP
jgi:hypothetical protein